MLLPAPIIKFINHTAHTIRASRIRRQQKAAVLSLMLTSRVLRPAHLEIRYLRATTRIPQVLATPTLPKRPAHRPTRPTGHPHLRRQATSPQWNDQIFNLLALVKRRLLST